MNQRINSGERATPIAVTGATGRLGGRVAQVIADLGASQRLVVRTPSRAPQLPQATVAAADYENPAAMEDALRGTKVVLFVSAHEGATRPATHRRFVNAAAAAKVEHLVYTSFYGAAPDAVFTFARDHAATEEYIRRSGLGFTFLRNNEYADDLPDLAGEDGVIRGPAGDGRVAAVTVDDIAAVAASVLSDPQRHAGATYDLTGPSAMTLYEVADTITKVTGRPVAYQPETIDEAYASRQSYDVEADIVEGWVTSYTAIAAGALAGFSSAVRDILGRPPTSFGEFLRAG